MNDCLAMNVEIIVSKALALAEPTLEHVILSGTFKRFQGRTER